MYERCSIQKNVNVTTSGGTSPVGSIVSKQYPRKLDDERVLVKMIQNGEHVLHKDELLEKLHQLIDAAKLMGWVGSDRTDWCPLCNQGWDAAKEGQKSRVELNKCEEDAKRLKDRIEDLEGLLLDSEDRQS